MCVCVCVCVCLCVCVRALASLCVSAFLSVFSFLQVSLFVSVFALYTGFQSMLESNTNFVLFVLVPSLILVLSIFPIYSRFTHPLGNSNLPQTSVYCAFHLSTLQSYSECSFSYTAPTLWNTLPKDIRFSQSVSSFRSALKTHLFPT